MTDCRLFVNADRTVLVRVWSTGETEVCTRPTPFATWGPPTQLEEERS